MGQVANTLKDAGIEYVFWSGTEPLSKDKLNIVDLLSHRVPWSVPPRARARSRVGGRPPAADRSRRPRSAIGAPLLPAAHTTRRSVAAHRPRSITRTDHKHWLARMAASPAEVRFDYATNGPVIRSLFSLEAVAQEDASPGAIKVASRRAARVACPGTPPRPSPPPAPVPAPAVCAACSFSSSCRPVTTCASC